MKKLICFYTLMFLVVFCGFSCILPYPIFSRFTNSTEKQISQSGHFRETELSNNVSQHLKVLDITWNDGINTLLENNETFELYDFMTKHHFKVKRIGGNNHADIIPDTMEDFVFINENLSQNENIPVVLIYNENTLIPASLSTYMHGYADQEEAYFGHYCLHFKSSKMDEMETSDYYHTKNIKYAKNHAKNINFE